MFTQCPECRASFRVTASVLQQAAGRVRCGGCGHAFNALESLSEKPAATGGRGSLLEDFESISATDNLRIEDTGVEWQVVEDEAPAPADPQASLTLAPAPEQAEVRYDDNTPLPGTLDDDEEEPAAVPPRRRAEDFLEPRSPEFDERQVDLALSEPEDWTDLLAEVGEDDPPAAEEPEAGVREQALAGDDEPVFEIDEQTAPDVARGEAPEVLAGEPARERAHASPLEQADETAPGAVDEPLLEMDEHTAPDPASEPAVPGDAASAGMADERHYVPSTTEEEATLNRLIDEDLLRLSQEQQDLAATTPGEASARMPPHVETIIMEGSFVRSSLEANDPDGKPMAAGDDATGELLELRDTWALARDSARARRPAGGAGRYAATSAAAALALLLCAQVVHAYRETLATCGTLGESLISLYEVVGAPITPLWDVNGWQFHATHGSTGGADDVLTISTTLTNASEQALPYPLLHVALTDRYEEILASQLLRAGQYLEIRSVDGHIASGDKLQVKVTIAPLAPQAEGFKLNVCYPLSATTVRCATGAFKER